MRLVVLFVREDLVLTPTNYGFGSWKYVVSLCLCWIVRCVLVNFFNLVEIMH